MHILSIADLSSTDINNIFKITDRLKGSKGKAYLGNTVLTLLFEKASTRTRLSFESAMMHLGGQSVYMDASTTHLSRGESISDTAKVLGLYSDIIAARLYSQADLAEIAKNAGVPVINALTDLEHPCQALSDLYTMRSRLGSLKGKKFAFIGDITANTSNSLLLACTKLGMEVALVGPKNYEPLRKYLGLAKKSGKADVYSSIEDGLKDSDVVYTDTFVSMGEEASAKKRKKELAPYQLNSKALGHAKPRALVMHCLPAHRGEEITAGVIDGPNSVVWEQAAKKMHVEKAIILYALGRGKEFL